MARSPPGGKVTITYDSGPHDGSVHIYQKMKQMNPLRRWFGDPAAEAQQSAVDRTAYARVGRRRVPTLLRDAGRGAAVSRVS